VRPNRPATVNGVRHSSICRPMLLDNKLMYDGVPVRTHFRFASTGKISLTACAPIRAAA
jgi:hypothetical protein